MMRFELLLDRWDDGRAGEAEVRELIGFLSDSNQRAELVRRWVENSTFATRYKPAAGTIPFRPAIVKSARWRAVGMVAGMVAMLALVLALVSILQPEQPTVGRLTLKNGVSRKIFAEQVFEVPNGSDARFADLLGSNLHIFGGSKLKISEQSGRMEVQLFEGALDAELAAVPKAEGVVIETERMKARIDKGQFRLIAASDSSWLALRSGNATVTRRADGKSLQIGKGNYSAVHPNWPFMRMNAYQCPVWKAVSKEATGSEYP